MSKNAKAPQDWHTSKAGVTTDDSLEREAFWTAPVPWRSSGKSFALFEITFRNTPSTQLGLFDRAEEIALNIGVCFCRNGIARAQTVAPRERDRFRPGLNPAWR